MSRSTFGFSYCGQAIKKTFRSAVHASELPELVAMRKLTEHPNILHMIEAHFDPLNGKVTFIFELMEMSLYDLMKNRKRCIPEARAKNYLYQIVKGVDHIHQHGIFHRDIKPENILVKGELLKISDLGSIKGIYTKPPYTEYISTRWYRSPECLLTTGFYGPKMDVWAIGCVFLNCSHRLKPLFPGGNELDQIAKINNVLGTPSSRLLSKFRKYKCRNVGDVCFTPKQGTGLNPLIPLISEAGRDVMKQMVVYDPEGRTNIRRLMEHKYFNDLREAELISKRIGESTSSCLQVGQKTWRNPALLSYLTSERRHKPKRKLVERRKNGEKILVPILTKVNKSKSNKEEGKIKDENSKIHGHARLKEIANVQSDTLAVTLTNNSFEKRRAQLDGSQIKFKEAYFPQNKFKKNENEVTNKLTENARVYNSTLNQKYKILETSASSLPILWESKMKMKSVDMMEAGSIPAQIETASDQSTIPRLAKKPFVLGYRDTGVRRSSLLKATAGQK